jgi:hypothetical protein
MYLLCELEIKSICLFPNEVYKFIAAVNAMQII